MLKLMNSVILLVIFCGGFHLCCGEKLVCQFEYSGYSIVGDLYTCKVTSLDNSFDNIIIDGYTGVHKTSKNDKDVKGIYIESMNTKYIPEALGSLFNLLALAITSSQLVEIRSNDLQRMENLELLSLSSNKLLSLPSDAFSMIPKLKYIDLRNNQIQYIGSGAFDQQKNLKIVVLFGNICVKKHYIGATAINQMKEDLKVNCVEPIPTTTSTQNPMEVELETLKNELAASSEELQKEKSENLKVKIERDQLEKELTEAKETIAQKLPKMEQTIEDFYMEVMDLKIERHNERQNSIGLRSKLMEANEKLAECKNE